VPASDDRIEDRLDDRTAAKRAAGEAAADQFVSDGMRVGLGTGSTAIWAIRRIAERLAAGDLRDVVGVPTSRASEAEAVAAGIPLTTLDEHPVLDVTVDGADEVSPRLDLIKGGGGAHLREKIVAQASTRLVVVVDESKLVPVLGTGFPIPVEVVPFAARPEQGFLEALGARVTVRLATDGTPFVTDEGNHILDADFGPLAEPAVLLDALQSRAGIVAVGLFLDLASYVVVARSDGSVDVLERLAQP
jgi:ribose 5-phosphate isomerase A